MSRNAEPKIYSVGELNQYIKIQFDNDMTLRSVAVRGEISNYKVYSSGHHYFSLKDKDGVINCVMFKSSAQHLRFKADNGVQVIAFGRVSVFPRDGKYQLYVDLMASDGAGDLNAAFERLKKKLDDEGLFDRSHKKEIPIFPKKIALITSESGAAVRDMIRILRQRWPYTKVLVMSVRVQGKEAPAELCGAVRYANRYKVADLLIIGRGGGSIEDLWAFNDERLARMIYASEIPVISAVGHEPDVTISDYVADLRASTPSNGAELAVPDMQEIKAKISTFEHRLIMTYTKQMQNYRKVLSRLESSRVLKSPQAIIDDRRILTDYQVEKLRYGLARCTDSKRSKFSSLCASLDSLSPLKVLSRGYALVQDKNGNVIASIEQVQENDRLNLSMQDGLVVCDVLEKRPIYGSR